MREFEYVIPAEHKLAGHWINEDPERFAVLPVADQAAFERVAGEVEDLVADFLDSASSDDKADYVGRLLRLHARGAVLWPIGALFNHSLLGAVDVRRIDRDQRDAGSDLTVILDELDIAGSGPFAEYKPCSGGTSRSRSGRACSPSGWPPRNRCRRWIRTTTTISRRSRERCVRAASGRSGTLRRTGRGCSTSRVFSR